MGYWFTKIEFIQVGLIKEIRIKHALIISFDLLREGENNISLSVASLLAYLKNDDRYGKDFIVNHLSFNMWRHENIEEALYKKKYSLQLKEIDTIGISSYVWNEYLINPMLDKLRTLGFVGKIVLGGYQISYNNQRKVKDEYPKTDIFIFGYGEQSFLESIFLKKPILPVCLDSQVDFSKIPSVYTTNTIPIYQNQKMVRWETKRGCPYKCTFCAHRDLGKNKVDKIFSELSFFKKKHIKRINIVDPVFNVGGEYLNILKEIYRINLTATVNYANKV